VYYNKKQFALNVCDVCVLKFGRAHKLKILGTFTTTMSSYFEITISSLYFVLCISITKCALIHSWLV